MGATTGIGWCDATWNPWQGCHKVSPGCKYCYMFREKEQYGQEPNVIVRSKPRTFNLPLRLKQPARVFTCSWSDFFIEEADPWRDEAWAIIQRTPHLTYQILTKRIERVSSLLPWGTAAPWPNVQLIVSAEDQERADKRIPELLRLNVAVRGVSYEPALEPVDFERSCSECERSFTTPELTAEGWGHPCSVAKGVTCCESSMTVGFDWLIVGGESGPHARPFDLAWARSAIAQCRAAGVPVFVKQLGARPVVNGQAFGREVEGVQVPEWKCLRDRVGADPEEWPSDLRVQEFPAPLGKEPER